MCRLLFEHVGEFRKHTTEIAMRIVDNLHEPQIGHKVNEDEDDRIKQIEPKKFQDKKEGDQILCFMDEIDNTLYF